MKKIALIGNGYWGRKIKNYIPEFFGLKYVADSSFKLEKIWEDEEVSSVIIATPIETHYSIAKDALLTRKNVFLEKPITTTLKEATALRDLAKLKDVKIAVNYVQTFSKSIDKIQRLIKMIGEIEFIEMSTKHLGRFMDFDVYWLLASHHLSILDMFIDLDTLKFTFQDHIMNEGLCTSGSILFDKGRIDTSLNFPGKELLINFYGKNGTIKYNPLSAKTIKVALYKKLYKELPPKLTTKSFNSSFDERNNLQRSIEYFKIVLEGKELSNLTSAIKITKILESKNA